MDLSDKRYSEEEVSAVIKRALSQRSSHETISHEDLIEIARHTGVSRDELEAAIREEETEGELERARQQWLQSRHNAFYARLRRYLIVIGALMLINLMTTRYPWVIWPMIGLGIGLATSASNAFFVSDARIERGARNILRRGKLAKHIREEFLGESSTSYSR